MSKGRLDGKVAVVSGGASGIGEATVRLFAAHGATVVVVDIQDELGGQVAASIGHPKCIYKHCDVTDESQVKETMESVTQTYGKLDILFSNAGFSAFPTCILDMDMGEFDRTMAVNLRGSAAMVKHASRAMVSTETRGSIVCTASISGVLGGITSHSYTTSKHAVVGLVTSAASEVGKYGIRVNCVSPYALATPLACGTFGVEPEDFEAFSSSMSNLKGIVLKTQHVAEAVLFLASDESAYISGHNLVVDGGFCATNHAFGIYNK